MPVIDRFDVYRAAHVTATNDFTNPNVAEHYPPDLELEPIHLDIDLSVDIDREEAIGTVTNTVLARRNGPTSIELDAVDFLDLKVTEPDGNKLTWSYDGKKLSIDWLEPFTKGEERRVAASYRVSKPADGLYFSKPTSQYPDQAWFAASDHETERARHWLPCIDLPNVRTTLTFRLRAEERFTILANGFLVEETVNDDGTKIASWRLDQRCPSYLVCIAIGDFIRADDGHFDNGDIKIPLAYFCSKEHDAESLLRSFGRTGDMLEWMTQRLDLPFPFPKYYQFALPQLGGAMENISLVSWDDNYVLNEESAKELGLLVDIINVHEMAHSYFGDAVVVRDFAHAWLKESWATYMEQIWCEEEQNESEAQYVYYDNAKAYFREADDEYKRPIVTRRFKSSWQLYDRHLYPGGACRLHTLRRELGDDVFWPAVQDYLKRFSEKVVETDDFRQVMEEHSGRSLGKFFHQWFHTPAYPDIKVKFSYDGKQKQGTFDIEQQQVDLEKDIPEFVLNTSLGWTIDGKEFRLPIELKQAKQTFIVEMTAEPEMVRFDPDYQVLHKLSFNPGSPKLRRQLIEAPDVIGRIQAAWELAKEGSRSSVKAIIDAYDNEPFWGAREQFVQALAKAGSISAIDGIAAIVKSEADPMVLPAVFRAAGGFRDSQLSDAIGERLKGELTPLVRREAYKAMGNQRKHADWALLVEGSQQRGHNGFAQAGAFIGMAASRREEAIQLMTDQVRYGRQSNRVRPSIVTGLADIGKTLEKGQQEEVVELLADLLRDPWRRVRIHSAIGLVKMRAVEAIPALEAFNREQSAQLQVFYDRLIEQLKKSDKSDGSAVRKKVEDLEKKVRQLEDHVQRLEAKSDIKEGETG